MRKGDIPDPPFDEKILQGDRFSPYSIIEKMARQKKSWVAPGSGSLPSE
jgi:hypothetical protein